MPITPKKMIMAAVLLLAVALLVSAPRIYQWYKTRRFNNVLREVNRELKQAEKDDYAAAMSDTYG
ncbi:MAG: hypothetical protein HY983_03890, partial [Candidatus Magasanikbacteria bacterium]|nr:hypothetical protein [Candidatus Magasanikbacteria bacterium]